MIKIKSGKSVVMNVILLVSVLTTTIVYSAFSTQLQIQGDAVLRAKKDIRITNIKTVEYEGDAIEVSNSKYSVDTTSIFVSLPVGASIKYEVTITNKSDVDYLVSNIDEISHNKSVSYEVSLKVDEDIIDYAQSSGATEKKFTITIKNETETQQEETLFLQYTFEEASYKASQLSYNNTSTTCKTAQCALDEVSSLIK